MGRKKRIIVSSGGIGTDIAKVLETTGVKKVVELFVDGKDCGCKEREDKLNKLFPHKYKARCFTEEEYNEYKNFREVRTLTLSRKQVEYICELHHSVFQLKGNVYYDCIGCSPRPLIKKLDLLDKVFEAYEN